MITANSIVQIFRPIPTTTLQDACLKNPIIKAIKGIIKMNYYLKALYFITVF